MKESIFYCASAVGPGHETSRPATHSPMLGGPILPKEDIGSSCGEEGPYGTLSYNSGEHQIHSGFHEQGWPAIEVTSSVGSSSPGAFTPVEGTASPASFAGLPVSDTLNPPSFVNSNTSQLQSLAGPEAGMQSPASWYPNSPSDSFGGSDVHVLQSHISPASPSASQADGTDMDSASASGTANGNSTRPNGGDRPYAQLLRDCFLSRPDHSMSLKEIYAWFEQNTTKGNQANRGWQNSIRHNLSMNAAFKKQDATHLSTDPSRDVSRPRTNVWTMEDWAVEGRVLSTTRYRKSNSGRRNRPGHRGPHTQTFGHAGGHYVLSSGQNLNQGMNRAAAGRRGGVATANARERRRAETQGQRHQDTATVQQHPGSLLDVSNKSWAVPRGYSTDMITSYPVEDNVRISTMPPGVHGYVGLQSGVNMGPVQMYDYSLPEASSSSTLSMGSLQGVAPHMPSGSHQTSEQHHSQHQQQAPTYFPGFPRTTGLYGNGHGSTSAPPQPDLTPFVPSFSGMNSHDHHKTSKD